MPSLYETTAPTGEVSSSNFTTLYNASGLAVPNAGAGSVTGNLNVSGNLTVQGTSQLIGAVVIGSTLSTPNYQFPLADGDTDQVLVSDGNGNLYWDDVQNIPGAAYSISATTATGGANLTLADSAGGTDSVKFAAGTNVTVTRTDANTITISSSADDIPDGTAQGQVLYWDGSAWTANSTITSLATANRFTTELKNSSKSFSGSAVFRRNYASSTYVEGDASSVIFQVDSDSQAIVPVGTIGYNYSTTNPALSAYVSTDSFATSTEIAKINLTNVEFNGTNLYLNKNHTGAPSSNAAIIVERGSSTDATLTWNESNDQWELNNQLYITSGNLYLNGDVIGINQNDDAVDSYLYMKGSSEYLKWNNTDTRFELSDQLYSSQTDVPAIFEAQTTTAQASSESVIALQLIERVTDAGSNSTNDAGPAIQFARTSGASGGPTASFAEIGANYFGVTNTAEMNFWWSNDNFTETSPGTYPGTYTMLRLGSNDSNFLNNSLYVDYSAQGATAKTATSITGGNTLVFGSAHGFTAGQRIYYTSATQNGLTQNTYYYVLSSGLTSTQCQIALVSTGSALALTNGTGLSLAFYNLINRVGINTGSPAYTLDVDGDVNVTGDIYVSGYQIDINSPAAGQVITFDGTKFINNSVVSATNIADRFTAELQNSTSGVSGVLAARKNLTSTPYANVDGSSVVFQVDSNSQAVATFASVGARYDATTPSIGLSVSTNNFTTSTTVAGFDAGAAELSATTLTLNSNHTGAPTLDASIIVERGSSTDANITWDETNDRWTTSNDLAIQPGTTTQIALYLGDNASVASALTTTTSTSTTAVASTTRNTLTGTLSIKDTVTNALHTVSFTALRNGATALLTTYGELYTASALATFTADISGGSVRLLATPASSNNTTFTVVRTGIN